MTDSQSTDQNNNESKPHTLMHYNARSFKHAFDVLVKNQKEEEFTGPSDMLILPILFLCSHAVECYLKSFLLFKGESGDVLKKKYGHDLKQLHGGFEKPLIDFSCA